MTSDDRKNLGVDTGTIFFLVNDEDAVCLYLCHVYIGLFLVIQLSSPVCVCVCARYKAICSFPRWRALKASARTVIALIRTLSLLLMLPWIFKYKVLEPSHNTLVSLSTP